MFDDFNYKLYNKQVLKSKEQMEIESTLHMQDTNLPLSKENLDQLFESQGKYKHREINMVTKHQTSLWIKSYKATETSNLMSDMDMSSEFTDSDSESGFNDILILKAKTIN